MNETTVARLHPNIVYVSLKQVYNTVDECDDLINKIQGIYNEYIASGQRFVFVFNTERVNYCQPLLLKRFANWMGSKRDVNERHLICSYVIITNTFTRSCFNTIVQIFKPTKPYNIRESASQVNRELPEVLRSAGIA